MSDDDVINDSSKMTFALEDSDSTPMRSSGNFRQK